MSEQYEPKIRDLTQVVFNADFCMEIEHLKMVIFVIYIVLIDTIKNEIVLELVALA